MGALRLPASARQQRSGTGNERDLHSAPWASDYHSYLDIKNAPGTTPQRSRLLEILVVIPERVPADWALRLSCFRIGQGQDRQGHEPHQVQAQKPAKW